ncbi:MAG: hypothetical protein ACU837_15740 [Gammaproteobacteria bacterium]
MVKRAYRRFLMLSSPRSGTHMLRTSLNMHPAIEAKTEMFNPDWTKQEAFDETAPALSILNDHIFCEYPSEIAAVGFILHRSGARFGNWPELWPLLEADSELRVISLRRCNLLQRYLSYHAMRDRNQGRAFRAKHLSVDELRAEFEQQEQALAEFDQRFAGHPMMKLSYEQLCGDYRATLRRVQTFIGAPYAGIIPGTERNEQIPLHESIANFDELANAFADTRWSWFFREEPQQGRLQAQVEISIA